MNPRPSIIAYGIFLLMVTFAIAALLADGYMFYLAPCSLVKDLWLIVQVPARCI